jgi:hypothetical protein
MRWLVTLALLVATPAYAGPCDDARPDGERVSITTACARYCATASSVTVPTLQADLRLCRAVADADTASWVARLAACDAQVREQRRLLDDAARGHVLPWYRSPWIWAGVGAVVGGGGVWLLHLRE